MSKSSKQALFKTVINKARVAALGITFARLALALCWAIVAAQMLACAASDAEIRRAQHSAYKTDFATVYGEVLEAVVRRYPRSRENAVDGVIRTAWHRVSVQTGSSNRSQGVRGSQVAGTKVTQGLTNNVSSDRKDYYIRFRVHVVGGKPWRVRVVGEASEWSAGDVPVPLRGAEVPHWLKGRTNALEVDIYNRLKKYAVDAEPEIPQAKGSIISIDEPTSFGDIPEGAQLGLANIRRALSLRSIDDLQLLLAQDVRWSPNEVGSATIALAMWQADSSLLDAMAATMDRGCVAGEGGGRVLCPAVEAAAGPYRGFHLVVAKRGERWLLTSFVRDE